MYKRIKNSLIEKSSELEEIPGIEIKIAKILNDVNKNRFGRDFLVMSTGVVYSRPSSYTSISNEKWIYLHDDILVESMSNDRAYLLNSFRIACLDSTNKHILLYKQLFIKAEKNHQLIKRAIINYREEMTHHYRKMGISRLITSIELEPWI